VKTPLPSPVIPVTKILAMRDFLDEVAAYFRGERSTNPLDDLRNQIEALTQKIATLEREKASLLSTLSPASWPGSGPNP
jgi:hypothetical protein